jgi:hypothetical protein
LKLLDRQVDEIEAQIKAWHRDNEISRRLERVPYLEPSAKSSGATDGCALSASIRTANLSFAIRFPRFIKRIVHAQFHGCWGQWLEASRSSAFSAPGTERSVLWAILRSMALRHLNFSRPLLGSDFGIEWRPTV